VEETTRNSLFLFHCLINIGNGTRESDRKIPFPNDFPRLQTEKSRGRGVLEPSKNGGESSARVMPVARSSIVVFV
jgi:hypothetical protein